MQGQKFGFRKAETELVGTQMLLGRDDDVHGGHFILMQAEEGAKNPLDAVSGNGIAAFFCDSKPETPGPGTAGTTGEHNKVFGEQTPAAIVAGGVLRPAGDASFSGPGQ